MTRDAARMRRYRRLHAGVRCSRCASTDLLPGLHRCAWCRALDAERKPHVAHLRHHTAAHAEAIRLAHAPAAVCALSGLTLAELLDAGLRLDVDRINGARGYVRGNLWVIASRLNRQKQAFEDRLPAWCVDELVKDVRMETRRSRHA